MPYSPKTNTAKDRENPVNKILHEKKMRERDQVRDKEGHHDLYNCPRWRKLRLSFLKRNPLCVMCKKDGKVKEANVVDHIWPHKGDYALFWMMDNHQAICKECHDSTKRRMENYWRRIGLTCKEFFSDKGKYLVWK